MWFFHGSGVALCDFEEREEEEKKKKHFTSICFSNVIPKFEDYCGIQRFQFKICPRVVGKNGRLA